jgi:hypothetical protein
MQFEMKLPREWGLSGAGEMEVEGLLSRANSLAAGGKKAGEISPEAAIRISRLRQAVCQ